MYTALLTAMVLWISTNFDLPPDYKHPNIQLVPASEIMFLRNRAFTADQQRELLSRRSTSAAHTGRREAVAIYEDETATIFLPDTWKGDTPADLSVLIQRDGPPPPIARAHPIRVRWQRDVPTGVIQARRDQPLHAQLACCRASSLGQRVA